MSMEPSDKPAKSVRRFGVGLLTVIQVICMVVLLLAVNYLSSQHFKVKDLSGDAAYTLSSSTQKFLASDTIQKRETPIKLLVAFRRNAPFYDRLRALAEDYERLSNGKIELKLLDPRQSPDDATRQSKEYGAIFNATYEKDRSMFTSDRDLIVVDARTKAEREATDPKAKIESTSHIRFIESDRMIQLGSENNGPRKPTGYLGEDAITTALLRAIEGKSRKIYFLADKCAFAEGGPGSAWANFESVMLSRNLQPQRITIAGLDSIPEDASAVAIVQPAYDFSPEELKVLEDYWTRPRSSILVAASGIQTPPRLRAFLRNNGVTPQQDQIVRMNRGELTSLVIGDFTQGMDFTKEFSEMNNSILFEGATSSLEVRDQNADDLASRGITPFALIETGKDFWGEVSYDQGNSTLDPQKDNVGPLRVAAAVIRGAPNDDKLASQVSRLIVVGNSDFLKPDYFSSIHRDFLASAVDWMVGREELQGFGPRTFGTYRLPLLDSQISFINRVNLMILPAFALVIGALVWSTRRA